MYSFCQLVTELMSKMLWSYFEPYTLHFAFKLYTLLSNYTPLGYATIHLCIIGIQTIHSGIHCELESNPLKYCCVWCVTPFDCVTIRGTAPPSLLNWEMWNRDCGGLWDVWFQQLRSSLIALYCLRQSKEAQAPRTAYAVPPKAVSGMRLSSNL